MPTVVGIRLRTAGQILTFDAAGTEPVPGDVVIVSTQRGEEIGQVVTAAQDVEEEDVERKLKPVLRVANDRDLRIAEELTVKEAEAMERFRSLVSDQDLDMKPVAVEALFDGRKMVFYFTAEERIDFRDLVKELARDFKARVDMRQIGVRDEARMVGGMGHCGQQLCCVRFGGEFEPVSIRMAKAQDLPLNPLKISGLCGRLMCCLRYEYEAYKDFKSRAPKVGATIDTPKGAARVVALDAPRETVTITGEDGRLSVPLEKMECGGCQSGKPCKISEEAFASIQEKKMTGLMGALDASALDTQKRPSREGGRKDGASDAKDGKDGKDGPAQGGKKGQPRSGEGKSRGSRRRRKSRSKGGSQGGSGDAQAKAGQNKTGARSGSQKQSGQGASAKPKSGQGRSGRSGSGSSAGGSAQGAAPKQGDGRRRRRRHRPADGGGESGSSS